MGRTRRAAASGGGFTLIEVLVALVILVLALGALLEIFATGLRGVRQTEAYTEAVLLAESKLAGLGVETPLEEGVRKGRFGDRFRWRTTVRPFEGGPESAPKADSPAAYAIDVTVLWGTPVDERSVSLATVRLAPPQ